MGADMSADMGADMGADKGADPRAMGGRTVLVTGGTGGIGLATASALASMGARVGLVGRNESRATAAAEGLRSTGAEVDVFTADLSVQREVRALAAAVLELVDGDQRAMLHVAGADAVDRLTFARLLATSMGLDANALKGRPRDPALGPRPGNLSLDCAKARALLATPLTGVRATLSRPEPRSDTDS